MGRIGCDAKYGWSNGWDGRYSGVTYLVMDATWMHDRSHDRSSLVDPEARARGPGIGAHELHDNHIFNICTAVYMYAV